MGFIEQYVNLVSKYTDAPEIFVQASGYHIISNTLGPYFRIMSSKCDRPNLWFMLSSIPGRTRRSTIIGYDSTVLQNAWTKFFIETSEENISQKVAYQRYMTSVIETGSKQGICDKIVSGIDQGLNVFDVHSHEYGDVLRQMCQHTKTQTYTSGVDTLLSRLYYGESFVEDLSRRRPKEEGGTIDRIIPAGLYITMFAGMQEPKMYLTKDMNRQGLLRRILILHEKTEDMTMGRWKPPLTPMYTEHSNDLKEFASDLVKEMIRYKNALDSLKASFKPKWADDIVLLYADLCDVVRNEINSRAKQQDENLIKDPSDFNIYQQTLWENTTKLTILEALASNAVVGKERTTMVIASESHYQKAKEFMDRAQKNTEQMMEDLGVVESDIHVDMDSDRVLRYIKKAGQEGITTSYLLTRTGYKAYQLQECIRTLLKRECIKVEDSRNKTGRPGWIYYPEEPKKVQAT